MLLKLVLGYSEILNLLAKSVILTNSEKDKIEQLVNLNTY